MSKRTPWARTAVSSANTRTPPSNARPQFELHRVRGGVVAGRIQMNDATCRTECWSFFTSVAQFDACSALDDIRFTYPLMHERLLKEFRNAFDEQPASTSSAGASHT